MPAYTIEEIGKVINADTIINTRQEKIEFLLTDSRRIAFPKTSLFIAIHTERRNGHDFIKEVYDRGVRNFITEKGFNQFPYPNANFLQVEDTLVALQKLAASHRRQFDYPVIGITGSNGKTIVKEWLYQLLHDEYSIVRSPRSYNSQIGVPLSIWQMSQENDLAIFEAGISQPGEMIRLEKMIAPSIGIITNIGDAHNEGFTNIDQKLEEKLILFNNTQVVFCNKEDDRIIKKLENKGKTIFSFGRHENATLNILSIAKKERSCDINAVFNQQQLVVSIPFSDDASIQNAIICWSVLLYLRIPQKSIEAKMKLLRPVDMRLQLIQAENGCSVINDSYSFDIASFSIALDFLSQQLQYPRKSIVLSDLPQGASAESYRQVIHLALQKNIYRIITIGPEWTKYQEDILINIKTSSHFPDVDAFLRDILHCRFENEIILLKGARAYEFERIANALQKKVHNTVMEINLSAIAHNLNQYKSVLKPGTRLMAMVKAYGYGSGSTEVGSVLQYHKVDYLAVAYADEGIELRKAGISLPILVLNVDEAAFDSIIEYSLEPELFSFSILQSFLEYLKSQALTQYPIHIKVDTGMHRLGFEESDMENLLPLLINNDSIIIKSVFTHLAASDDAQEDAFTLQQAEVFNRCCLKIKEAVGYGFIKHVSNSAAIVHMPQLQFDMVRLGIGLYGVDSSNEHSLKLRNVASLNTTIAQLRKMKAGETIGYNRRGVTSRDSVIATIRIGYADGYSRKLGYGYGKVYIKGYLAPVIGTVCMDMTMVDVTDIPDIKEDDPVEIFGDHIPVNDIAQWSGTIAYEVLTGIGPRVKKIYVEE